jgi:hypothetical protein
MQVYLVWQFARTMLTWVQHIAKPKYIGFSSLLVCLGYQPMIGLGFFIKHQNIESKV